MCEELGFESLWFAEHSHIPTSRTSPWGGVEGASPLPEKYRRTHDAFVALGAIAGVTNQIKLCTGITLIAQRDAIWTAKEVASLDVISGGRAIFGIGYGWNREEMASHGVDYRVRRDLTREKVLMMKALWTDDIAAFEGELISLPPSWAWPKPLQKPHPPIILGAGAGPKTIAHLAEFCDGWIPLGRHELEGKVDEVREAVAATGREGFEITYYGAGRSAEGLDRLAALGIERAVFRLESDTPDEVRRNLRECAAAMADYAG